MSSVSFRDTSRGPGASPGVSVNPAVSIWRQRLVFLPVFVVVLACAALALVVLPSRYFASGSVIVAEPETGLSLPPAGWAQKVGDPADMESQLLVVRSPRILRLVANAPGVAEAAQAECGRAFKIPFLTTYSCDALKPDTPELLDYLQSRYSSSGAGRSRVITIGYTSPEPETAQQMANTLINLFLEDHRQALSSGRAVAAKGIAEEMARLDGEIAKGDAAVQAYKTQKGLLNGANGSFTSERLSSISQQLATAEASRDGAAAILATAQAGGNVATLPAVLESRAVADIKQQLLTVNEQAGSAAITLGPRHPRLRSLQGQVQTLQKMLDTEIRNVVASARKEYDAARDKAASLRAQMETAKSDVSEATIDEGTIEQAVRDVAIKRQQYDALYEQRKTLESEQRAVLGSTRLVSLAERPLKRSFPKTIPFLAGGTVLGLMAATGAALLLDRWQGRARPANIPDAPVQQGIPVLARLRKTTGAGQRNFARDLVAADDDPDTQLALQELYNGIEASGGPVKSRSVLGISAFPQQGKTFAIMALARYAASIGNHVLVVEGNMREPFLEKALDLQAGADLQAVLLEKARPQLAVCRTDLPRLDVIVARRTDDDPAELLVGNGLSALLEWAEIYDLVLFDSPALDAHMDAGLLARKMDGLLLCTREENADSGAIAMITRRLTRLGARMLGIVYTAEQRKDPPVQRGSLLSLGA